MFDIISYILGKTAGKGEVVIEGDLEFEDDGDGNITVEEKE